MAQPEGIISGVSMKLVSRQKGNLEKLMAEVCWGGSGFLQWNSVMSLFPPLKSPVLALRSGCSWGLGLNWSSSGFIRVWTVASACVLCLPTNSVQIIQIEPNFGLHD